MTIQEIKTLPPEEKLRIMEVIWEDMREHYETATLAPELVSLLKQRRERVAQGKAKLLDWDQVKFALGRG